MSAPSTDRLAQLATLYVKHDAQLLRLVRRRVAAQPATAADACSYAWAQLLAAEHIDLTVPWGPLAWLTTTAVREAWRLNELEWRATPLSHDDLDAIANADSTRPSRQAMADAAPRAAVRGAVQRSTAGYSLTSSPLRSRLPRHITRRTA
jgi:Sigma-70 region 2